MRRTCTDDGKCHHKKPCCHKQGPKNCYDKPQVVADCCNTSSSTDKGQTAWISLDKKNNRPDVVPVTDASASRKKNEESTSVRKQRHNKGSQAIKGHDSSSSTKGQRPIVKQFSVTLRNGADSPNVHRLPVGAKVFAIQNHIAARLYLTEGVDYQFLVVQDPASANPQHFYLTEDIEGGPSDNFGINIPGTTPIINGIMSLKVDERTPRLFYYQSKETGFAGGTIIVKKD